MAVIAFLIGFSRLGSAHVVIKDTITVPVCAPQTCYYDTESIAVLENGDFAIARRVNSTFIQLVFLDRRGSARGKPIVIAKAQRTEIFGAIDTLGDSYLATWSELGSGRAFARRYDRNGKQAGPTRSWPFSDYWYGYQLLHFSPSPHGGGISFFAHQTGEDPFHLPTYEYDAQVIGEGGSSVGPLRLLVDDRRRFLPDDAAMNGNGRFLILGSWCPRNPLSQRPCVRRAQLFEGEWEPVTGPLSNGLPSWDPSRTVRASAAILENGAFGIDWLDESVTESGPEYRLRAQLFSPSGSPNGLVIQVSDETTTHSGLPLLRVSGPLSYAVVWLNIRDTFITDVYLREIDGTHRRAGPLVAIAKDAQHLFGYDFQVNAHGDGVILLGDHVTLLRFSDS